MRVRFEIRSLFALGQGVFRIPINCWRLTLNLNGNSAPGNIVLIENVDLFFDSQTDPLTGNHQLIQYTVGGVIVNGKPINLDQTLFVNSLVEPARGVLVLEYIEA